MSQQKSHIQCTNILSAHLLAFTKFRVPTAFDSSERLSSEWYKPPGTCSIKILMYPSSETDPRYWTMFRCFKYLCSAISSWRGWEYLFKKKRIEEHLIMQEKVLGYLNARLQTEQILGILIQFSGNILSVTFKMQRDWLPIQKKYRDRSRRNPEGETCPQKNLQMAFFCITT